MATASSGVMPPSTQSWQPRCAPTSAAPPARRRAPRRTPPAASAARLSSCRRTRRALVGQRRQEARQQVAVRAVQLQPVEAGLGRAGAWRRRSRRVMRAMSARSSRAAGMRGGTAAATPTPSGQLPVASGWSSPSPPRALVDPLGPAWPSCMPILGVEVACTKSTMRFQASRWVVVPQAGQPGVMRASGTGQVISAYTSPAPPSARAPRCTRWKSPGTPSTAEYWPSATPPRGSSGHAPRSV
jgi:hypothetical protein